MILPRQLGPVWRSRNPPFWALLKLWTCLGNQWVASCLLGFLDKKIVTSLDDISVTPKSQTNKSVEAISGQYVWKLYSHHSFYIRHNFMKISWNVSDMRLDRHYLGTVKSFYALMQRKHSSGMDKHSCKQFLIYQG